MFFRFEALSTHAFVQIPPLNDVAKGVVCSTNCFGIFFICNSKGHFEKHVLLMRRLLETTARRSSHSSIFANSEVQTWGFRRAGGASKSIAFRSKRASGRGLFFVGRKQEPKSRFQVFDEGSWVVFGASVLDLLSASSIYFESFVWENFRKSDVQNSRCWVVRGFRKGWLRILEKKITLKWVLRFISKIWKA